MGHSQVFLKFAVRAFHTGARSKVPVASPIAPGEILTPVAVAEQTSEKSSAVTGGKLKRVSEFPLNYKTIFFYPEMTRHNRLKAVFRQEMCFCPQTLRHQ